LAAASPAIAVIAIESRVSGARAFTLHDGKARNRAVSLLFYWLAMPFDNCKYRAFNHFLPGRHFEGR
jgi:hypothetical protein